MLKFLEDMEEKSDMLHEIIAGFIDEVKLIHWFKNSGIPNEKYHMVFSFFEAYDCWGKQHLEVWEPNICILEDIACEIIGDDEIDEVFANISAVIGDDVWGKFSELIERQRLDKEIGVSFELFDMVKRDIAWACIERILNRSGLFTTLLDIYKEGYLPCSWIGTYPSGQAVVL